MIRSLEGFYGRQRELQRTLARLGDTTPQSVSIVGERRVGKSSLLWHLAQPETAARYLDEPSRYVFVYIDFQGQRHLNLAGFSRVFSQHLVEAAGERVPVEAVADLSALEAQVRVLGDAGLRLVGLFDEFETVTGSGAFGAEFFGFLRSLANSFPVAYVTASRRDLPSLCRTQEISESPFFNIFARVALGPLDETDAARLVAEPSEAAGVPLGGHLAEIVDLGGSLPLFLQIACSAAFETVVESGTFDARLVQRRFRDEADSHFEYLWEHLAEAEQEVMRSLLSGAPLESGHGSAAARLEACGYLRRQGAELRPFSAALGPVLAERGLLENLAPRVSTGGGDAAAPPAADVDTDSQVLHLPPTPTGTDPFPNIVGHSTELRRTFTFIQHAAASDVTVLLLGETGTGKELVARTIHDHSSRRDGPFVVVNCGAIAENLQESELFGHRKGAFTDAIADREGLFEAAHGGTLLLDEIAEMAPSTQVKLLRVLQEGEVRRVGETTPRRVDVRVLGATNRDLEGEVAAGRFREDLYYRLCVLVARLPPLRQRRDDIPRLVMHFLGARPVSPRALALLDAHDWPGNVRELENQLAAAGAVAGGGPIQPEHLWPRLQRLQPVIGPSPDRPEDADDGDADAHGPVPEAGAAQGDAVDGAAAIWEGLSLREARDLFERDLLATRIRRHNGDLVQVAESLGISRSRFYELIRKYGLRDEG